MARCLIIGCGCRGLSLARELRAQGHAVRGTTRRSDRLPELEAAGVEPVHGDPDRVATIAPAFAQVSIVCVLLGSASGSAEDLRALYGTRLEMLLTRMLDTTIHGVVFEAAGTVQRELLQGAAGRVRDACEESRIPYVLLEADWREPEAWLGAAIGAVEQVLRGG